MIADRAPVLIAGGGPVGMTLALELAMHGVRSALFEQAFETTRHPKMDITNGRSMELFRRLGLAERLRAAAVPETHNVDVAWVTSMTGRELHRFHYPPPAESRRRYAAINDGAQPLEPPMRVSQVVIEPILQAAVLAEPLIDARWGHAVEGALQDASGVTLTVRDRAKDRAYQARGRWLAGCDGGGSAVREAVGVGLDGKRAVANRYMTHFRSDARELLQRFGVAWHYQSPKGTLIAQNDRDVWTLHARLPDDMSPTGFDPMRPVYDFVGAEFPAKVLTANPWTPHLLLADAYRKDRVFLAGDAAHQYIPTGGYGMNTGIGDAVTLGWMLAAVEKGWAKPALLDAYEAERRPVGRVNRDWSERHTSVRLEIMAAYARHAEADPAQLSRAIAAAGNLENEAYGLELAYRTDASPLTGLALTREAGPAPPDDPAHIPHVAWPGMRAPSFILPDGEALFDRFDPKGMTLVRFGGQTGGQDVPTSKVPLKVVDIQMPEAADVYGARQAVVRPDGAVLWRGDDWAGAAMMFERLLAI